MLLKKTTLFYLIFFNLFCFQSFSQDIPQIKGPNLANTTLLSVVRIIDGDTIVINNGQDITIRLIGVDTPETVSPSKPVEDYGKEAAFFLNNLLKGERVYLLPDNKGDKIDKYGRTLAYVYRAPDGLFVNAEIIRQGYGRCYLDYPFDYSKEFAQIETFAKKAQKGLWFAQAAVDESKFIVYITKSGTKYHLKGCRSLSQSSIPITLKEAKLKYGPCSVCNPPQ